MKEEEIIQAGIDYTLSTNPRCIAGDNFGNFSMTMNRNPSFEAGAKWMQEKMIEKMQKCLNDIEWCDAGNYIWYSKSEMIDLIKKAMKQ